MRIKVKTLTGKKIKLDVEPTDMVERIKEKVEEKEGIPPFQQRLFFYEKQIKDGRTCKEYKIIGGSVLHLTLAPLSADCKVQPQQPMPKQPQQPMWESQPWPQQSQQPSSQFQQAMMQFDLPLSQAERQSLQQLSSLFDEW